MAATNNSEKDTYHGDKSSHYSLPYDLAEAERLRVQHDAYLALLKDEPILSSLSGSPAKIVDIGCGVNADMTLYFANRFPSAKVYGVDLGEVKLDNAPGNVELIKGNITNLVGKDPRFQPGTFDLVYSRFLVAGISDWGAYVNSVLPLVAPGGCYEMHDIGSLVFYNAQDEVISDDWQWIKWIQKQNFPADDRTGQEYLKKLLRAGGLREVQSRTIKAPYTADSGQPESQKWREYIASGRLDTVSKQIFDKMLPGEKNRMQRETLQKEMMETQRPEPGKWMPFIAVWGKK